MMAYVAIRLTFDQGGATILTSALDGSLCGLMNSDYILAINFHAQCAIGRCATRHTRVLGRTLKGHFRRVQVVLTDIHDRQVPHRTEVDCLVKRTTVDRTFPKKTDDHLALLAQLGAERGPGGQWNWGTHDSVRAHKPVLGRIHVHAPAASSRTAGRLAPEFSQYNVCRYAFRQGVTMAAMSTEDQVGRFEIRTYANPDGFLPDVQMYKSGKHSVAI